MYGDAQYKFAIFMLIIMVIDGIYIFGILNDDNNSLSLLEKIKLLLISQGYFLVVCIGLAIIWFLIVGLIYLLNDFFRKKKQTL